MSALSVNELCKDLSKKRNSALLSLIFNELISTIHFLQINELTKGKKYDKLDIVLHSNEVNVYS